MEFLNSVFRGEARSRNDGGATLLVGGFWKENIARFSIIIFCKLKLHAADTRTKMERIVDEILLCKINSIYKNASEASIKVNNFHYFWTRVFKSKLAIESIWRKDGPFEFWHFPPIFVLLWLTFLVTLFEM